MNETLIAKLLRGSGSTADPSEVTATLTAHTPDGRGGCVCGAPIESMLEHLGDVALLSLGAPGPSPHYKPAARIGWNDGPTNRIDQLLDYDRDDAYIAAALDLPESLVRRRRRERHQLEHPVHHIIPLDRQIAIANAAADARADRKKHAA